MASTRSHFVGLSLRLSRDSILWVAISTSIGEPPARKAPTIRNGISKLLLAPCLVLDSPGRALPSDCTATNLFPELATSLSQELTKVASSDITVRRAMSNLATGQLRRFSRLFL